MPTRCWARCTSRPRDEVMYESEMLPSDPQWLKEHKVYGRVVMPGAVYGAMAATVPLAEGASSSVVEELQLHNPLVYPEYDADSEDGEPTRRIQMVVSGGKDSKPRQFEVYSKNKDDDGWTLHAEGTLTPGTGRSERNERVQLEALTDGLQPQDLTAYLPGQGCHRYRFWAVFPHVGKPLVRRAGSSGRSRAPGRCRGTGLRHPPVAAGRLLPSAVGDAYFVWHRR